MKRAAIYARVSFNGEEGESLSVTRQLALLRDLAKRENYDVVAEHVDDGISAWDRHVVRPAFEALRSDVTSGRVELVLVTALDRLSRNASQALRFQEDCEDHAVTWHVYEKGRFDPATDDGLDVGFGALLAQHESKVKSRRMKRALAFRAQSGVIAKTAKRAFGWTRDGQHHPTEGPLVTAAFDAILNGSTCGEISRQWSAAGVVRTVNGRPHDAGTVRGVLTNPRHAGIAVHLGQVLPDVATQWTPLTSKEKFEQVQALFAANKQEGRRQYVPKALLRGIIQCPCGSPMQRGYGTLGDKAPIYRCSAALRGAKGTGGHATVREEHADSVVIGLIVSEFSTGRIGEALAARTGVDDSVSALAALDAARSDLAARDARLLEGYEAGVLTLADIALKREKLARDVKKIESERARLVSATMDRSWIERAKSAAAAGQDSKEAAKTEFNALPLDDRRSLISDLFTVSLLPYGAGRTKPEDRVLCIFKDNPEWLENS